MDDEAYHSGILQSGAVSAESPSPSTQERVPAGPGTIPGRGTARDTGELIKSSDRRSQSNRKKAIVSRSARSPQTMPVPQSSAIPTAGTGDHTDLPLGRTLPVAETPSPTAGYDSGIFPSLPETEKTSGGHDQNTTLGTEGGSRERQGSADEGMDAESVKSSLSPPSPHIAHGNSPRQPLTTRTRSESPGIPLIGESIEVVTETGMEREMSRPAGSTAKRLMEPAPAKEPTSSAKSPRMAVTKHASIPAPQPSPQRAIRVPTIVSPGEPLLLASLMKVRRGALERLGERSQEKMEVQSPVTMDGSAQECNVVKTERSFPPSASGRAARVNYDSVQELAQSDVRCGEDTEKDSGVVVRPSMGQLAYSLPLTRLGETSAFTERRSPKPASSPITGATSPMSVENLISRVPKPRGASPNRAAFHSSVDSDKTAVDSERDRSEGYHSSELGGVASDEDKKEKKPEAQSALLQVSEAHLAILPDEDGDTPLHLAVIHESLSLTQYLVQLIVGVYMNLDIANNMRQTPLHLAVITRQPNMVRLLVGAGASVNFPDRKGNTSIHLAAQRRDVRLLQLLSQATSPLPDFNSRNFAGLTAVHVATREAAIDVLKFLFQMGANKNMPDSCSGRSPLHYAVESENFVLVNYLLENGCDVNSTTFAGNTPLHIAAGRRLKEIVALLMAYGANPAIANGEGDFPTDLPASLLMQRARMNAH